MQIQFVVLLPHLQNMQNGLASLTIGYIYVSMHSLFPKRQMTDSSENVTWLGN